MFIYIYIYIYIRKKIFKTLYMHRVRHECLCQVAGESHCQTQWEHDFHRMCFVLRVNFESIAYSSPE